MARRKVSKAVERPSFVGALLVNAEHGSMVWFSPGTGPVENATFDNARDNLVALLGEVHLTAQDVTITATGAENGRYGFQVQRGKRSCVIEMPGLPLAQVRFTLSGRKLNAWDYPRLFVDGDSWLWCYAAECVNDALRGNMDERIAQWIAQGEAQTMGYEFCPLPDRTQGQG